MLNVVEELNGQRDRPPTPVVPPCEPWTQQPESHEHDQRVYIVQDFRGDQPGEEVTEEAAGVGHGPTEAVNLKRLQQMLCPMGENDHCKGSKGKLVMRSVEPFYKTERLTRAIRFGVSGQHIFNRLQ